MRKYDYAVYIGRFQPFHNGHLSVAQKGLEIARELVMVIGSSCQPRTAKNPWTFQERREMIHDSITKVEPGRALHYIAALDYPYDDQRWADSIRKFVNEQIGRDNYLIRKVALIGHDKDGAGYWLKLFPEWDFVDVGYQGDNNATTIRDYIFHSGTVPFNLPGVVREKLKSFVLGPLFGELADEWSHTTEYKFSWKGAPFPPTFNVVDAVVTFGDYVLLVQRKNAPGKGLWALPGGFIEQKEWIVNAARREALEETGLDLWNLEPVGAFVFDHPDRSPRGRFISHTFHFDLEPLPAPPGLVAGDDAADARWTHLNDISREHLFADHWHILEEVLGVEKFQREYAKQKETAA